MCEEEGACEERELACEEVEVVDDRVVVLAVGEEAGGLARVMIFMPLLVVVLAGMKNVVC